MAKFKKDGQLVDMELVKKMKKLSCRACFLEGNNYVTFLHPKGGNELSNILVLCGSHRFEKQHLGLKTFAEFYSLPIDFAGEHPKFF